MTINSQSFFAVLCQCSTDNWRYSGVTNKRYLKHFTFVVDELGRYMWMQFTDSTSCSKKKKYTWILGCHIQIIYGILGNHSKIRKEIFVWLVSNHIWIVDMAHKKCQTELIPIFYRSSDKVSNVNNEISRLTKMNKLRKIFGNSVQILVLNSC